MRIFLIGFMGSGKSTIGYHLAKQLGWDFVDTDKVITAHTGLSIPEIFSLHGEEWFRKKEQELLNSLLSVSNMVIATGGGMPCFADNMDSMNRNGITVYLRLSPEVLTERLLHGHTERPLLQNKSPEELSRFVKESLKQREYFYTKAKIIVDAENQLAENTARLIREAINEI